MTSNPSPTELQKPLQEQPQPLVRRPSVPPIDQTGREAIAKSLASCYLVMRNYGKPPETLVETIRVFYEIFAHRDAKEVVAAIEKYMRTGKEFPTPADIVETLRGMKSNVEVV